MIQLIWKFKESKWNPYWLIALMNSSDTNYILNNNKNLGQYDQNAIPSQIMPYYSYPASLMNQNEIPIHDDVIKWKHFPHYWPFAREIHWSTVNSPHKGQYCGALIFSLLCPWINGWINNCEAGDLRCHRSHYDVIVMWVNMLTSSSGTDYVLNEHEYVGQ